ncbi:alpha/beta fold hydrolase [Alteromonas sp. CYL-A6]|uniref:alpha/beta fold hydrolase n=1 Tax=Alteromonas nitratireducens TaxID=3390813 RepID=UPI0034BD785B
MTIQAPVLFLPGTACDERVWLPVWQHLACRQRRYVPLQWASSLAEMLALTSDRVLDGEKVHLVGYSMGGYVASLFASEHADSVASLTLIGYDPKGLGDEETARRNLLVTFLKKGQFKPDSSAFLSRFIHPARLKDEHVAGVMTAMAADLGSTTLLAHTLSTTPRKPMTDTLSQASFPVNILGASSDQIAEPDSLRQAIKTIQPAHHAILDDTAHMMLLEAPQQVAALLQNWLLADEKNIL